MNAAKKVLTLVAVLIGVAAYTYFTREVFCDVSSDGKPVTVTAYLDGQFVSVKQGC